MAVAASQTSLELGDLSGFGDHWSGVWQDTPLFEHVCCSSHDYTRILSLGEKNHFLHALCSVHTIWSVTIDVDLDRLAEALV